MSEDLNFTKPRAVRSLSPPLIHYDDSLLVRTFAGEQYTATAPKNYDKIMLLDHSGISRWKNAALQYPLIRYPLCAV